MNKQNNIETLIYEIRGQLVIADRDVATLYSLETRIINQTVKRNIELFSDNKYFQLSNDEFHDWKSQNVISNEDKMGLRKSPNVFTLEGIKILSTILKKPDVLSVTNSIIDAFNNLQNKNHSTLQIALSKGEKREDLIYFIRGKQVMLDFDLARIYNCQNGTKTINLAVSRHKNSFPNDVYFQLTDEESKIFWFQSETKKMEMRGGKYNNPYAFTEEGVYMLATIIRTPIAEQVTRAIIKAFIALRQYVGENLIEQKLINNQVLINTKKIDKYIENLEQNTKKINQSIQNISKHDEDIQAIKNIINKFNVNKNINAVFFSGQIYDAYSIIIDLFKSANKSICLIDPYADKEALDITSKVSVPVTIITRDISKRGNLKQLDIDKYDEQYDNLTIIRDNSFHDRFIILDNSIVYHCGASINHAGQGAFAINLIEEKVLRETIINLVNNAIEKQNVNT